MRIACIFNAAREGTTGTYIIRALKALGMDVDHWWLRDAQAIPADYDLYFRIDHGDDYLVQLPLNLRPRIFYVFDTHLSHSWKKIKRVSPEYDLMVCCHHNAAKCLANALWLPVACDPEIHGSQALAAQDMDVAFVGTDGGTPRKFYLQALRERYPKHFIGAADFRDMNGIYSRAKIGFNCSIADDVNMRLFEAMAAGTLLVTNVLKSNDLAELGLHDRRHLVLYRKAEELFETIDYYLLHSEERLKIAQAGCALVKEKHTYLERMRQLLRCLEERSLLKPDSVKVK